MKDKTEFIDECKEILKLISERNDDECLFQIITLYETAERFLRETPQFKPSRQYCLRYPEIDTANLYVCDVCGLKGCQSDHK